MKKSKETVKNLNLLLASYQVFYMNARGFHWNIKGQDFFQLHFKFEELYLDSLNKIDEIAERILTLGGTPYDTFSNHVKYSTIKEHSNVSKGKQAVKLVIIGFNKLIAKEKKILNIVQSNGDEGTSSMIGDYIQNQEKEVWKYSSYLNN